MRNKTILITGGSRGLGFALAEYWGADNNVITLSRTRNSDQSKNIKFYECDLSDVLRLESVISKIISEFPEIDLLINNCGQLTTMPISVMNTSDITKMVNVNLLAPMIISKLVLRKMMGSKKGQIINIISMAPKLLEIGDSIYSATKAGLENFSKIVNRESHPFGVHVNNVGLSAFPTGMLDKIINGNPEKILGLIPHHQYAPLSEVIAAIEFFEKNALDVGGQTIYFGGVS